MGEESRRRYAAALPHIRAARAAISGQNPCEGIFSRKWLDPACVGHGCQSLVLAGALHAYMKAQRRMLNRWSEGDEAVKQQLWRDLHACEAIAVDALARKDHP